ncbi:hypothetical protein pb186bvf_001269 [Paramecium bursaria]
MNQLLVQSYKPILYKTYADLPQVRRLVYQSQLSDGIVGLHLKMSVRFGNQANELMMSQLPPISKKGFKLLLLFQDGQRLSIQVEKRRCITKTAPFNVKYSSYLDFSSQLFNDSLKKIPILFFIVNTKFKYVNTPIKPNA